MNNFSIEEEKKFFSDILYQYCKQYIDKPKELINIGWFNTKYNYEETINHNNLFLFPHYIEKKPNSLILFSTGSYAPMHNGHINSLIQSAIFSEKLGYNIVKIIISPSHDEYVCNKNVSTKDWNINKRMFFIEKQIQQYFIDNPDVIKFKDQIVIDIFESILSSCSINFSEVLEYINKSLDKLNINDCKIGYVFGSDNKDFVIPFQCLPKELKKKFVAFCVERKAHPINEKIKSSNIFYIKHEYNDISSTQIRQSFDNVKTNNFIKNYKNNSQYFIRQDTNLATKKWTKKYSEQKQCIINSYDEFIIDLEKVIKKDFLYKINTIKIKSEIIEQIINKHLNNKSIINIDKVTQHLTQNNLNYSRIFSLFEKEFNIKKIKNFSNQKFNLLTNNFFLMDDDIITGKTISKITNDILCENPSIKINGYINLLDEYIKVENLNNEFIDVVDARDFLIGANQSGLMCEYMNKQNRVPYIYPWINLNLRAKINNPVNFTLDVLKINKKFFDKCYFLKIDDIDFDLNLINYKIDNIKELLDNLENWINFHSNKN